MNVFFEINKFPKYANYIYNKYATVSINKHMQIVLLDSCDTPTPK